MKLNKKTNTAKSIHKAKKITLLNSKGQRYTHNTQHTDPLQNKGNYNLLNI